MPSKEPKFGGIIVWSLTTISLPNRQEGSNGDREMISAFHFAGFEVFDVHVSDLLASAVGLDNFQGTFERSLFVLHVPSMKQNE